MNIAKIIASSLVIWLVLYFLFANIFERTVLLKDSKEEREDVIFTGSVFFSVFVALIFFLWNI